MTKAFIVSYTDKETKKTIVNLHVGREPHFNKTGLQMVSKVINLDNVFITI